MKEFESFLLITALDELTCFTVMLVFSKRQVATFYFICRSEKYKKRNI